MPFGEELPKEVPPLITVVVGMGVADWSIWAEGWEVRLVERAPNLPLIAALIGTWSGEGVPTPSWARRKSAWLGRRMEPAGDSPTLKLFVMGPAVAGGLKPRLVRLSRA